MRAQGFEVSFSLEQLLGWAEQDWMGNHISTGKGSNVQLVAGYGMGL